MSPLESATSLTIFGLSIKDVLLLGGAIAGPALGYFAARSSAFAQLQKITFDASAKFVATAQSQHAADLVRISELEAEVLRLRKQVDIQIGTISSATRLGERKQRFIDDLLNLCKDHKIKVPPDWHP